MLKYKEPEKYSDNEREYLKYEAEQECERIAQRLSNRPHVLAIVTELLPGIASPVVTRAIDRINKTKDHPKEKREEFNITGGRLF